MRNFKKIALALGLCGVVLAAQAFKLSPEGSFIERKLSSRSQSWTEKVLAEFALKGIHKIGAPVHEEITNRVLGCEGDADVCGAPEYDPNYAYVLAGVRWNDDPPFRFEKGHGNFGGCEAGATVRLVTFPRCWANVFKDGEKRAEQAEKLDANSAPLLVRSHFGDMQFLHSMASQNQESPSETRARILAWAEFTWRVGLGEFPLATRVRDVPIQGFVQLFGNKGWSIQDLFALGNPHVRKPEYMAELAFGSLLHVVEDSFAGGHVERAAPDALANCAGTASAHKMPGKIIEFHSYSQQDAGKHGDADKRQAFSTHWSSDKPNVIDVGQTLYSYFTRKASWQEVQPYVACIFTFDNEARPASAGEAYSR